MKILHTKNGTKFQDSSPEESWETFDEIARKELGMSGKEFLDAWDAGKFDDNPDQPHIMHVVMLINTVRNHSE